MTLQPPKLVQLEDILKRRLPSYAYSDEYKFQYLGYLGEKKFSETFPVREGHLELHNIRIAHQFNFEIDRLIITGDTIYIFDVKNYSSRYKVEDNMWRSKYSNIKSPQQQFELLKQGIFYLAQDMNIPHHIVCKLIFINHTFNVDTVDADWILYNHIPHFMKSVGENPPCSQYEHEIKKHFQSLHRPITLYEKRPVFEIKEIINGIFCLNCGGKIEINTERIPTTICPCCYTKHLKEKLIKQALVELEFILDRAFNIKEANQWIGIKHRNITKRVLTKYFKVNEKFLYSSS